jgi:hypothetical protein
MPDTAITATLKRHLTLVQGHVDKGIDTIRRHRTLMERLTAQGRDLTDAQATLELLLDAHAMHIEHRDRLRRELGLPNLS